MTPDEFLHGAQSGAAAPPEVALTLGALWHAAAGRWDAAHVAAQQLQTRDGSWIHAHLHREEGDLANAAYWYAQAGQPMPAAATSIAAERRDLIGHFLRISSA